MPFERPETIYNPVQEVGDERASLYQQSELDVVPEIVLKPEEYGKGLPKGIPGETRDGYSFFELRKENEGVKAHYITSRLDDVPILQAVTKEQFDSWEKRNIIARPVKFVWSQEKELWVIEDRRK